MSPITFSAKLQALDPALKMGSDKVLILPASVSLQLPSRGMTMVKGTIDNHPFQAALEPDGQGSHWFRPDPKILKAIGAEVGKTVNLAIESTKDWPEPSLPTDLHQALQADPQAQSLWLDITPMARWDWIRWVGAAKQEETRQKRTMRVCSMLKAGKRRPCCFDRNQCTLTDA